MKEVSCPKISDNWKCNKKGILRLIQSVPSPKAEPFKMWLAQIGSERIDETFDPSKAIDRSIMVYRSQGFSDAWIEKD